MENGSATQLPCLLSPGCGELPPSRFSVPTRAGDNGRLPQDLLATVNGLPQDLLATVNGNATCIAFHSEGKLLAAGCKEGLCVVWKLVEYRELERNLLRLEVFKELRRSQIVDLTQEGDRADLPHGDIIHVSWAAGSDKLLVAGGDCILSLWDVEQGVRQHTGQFDTPILSATLHPQIHTLALVSPRSRVPHLVEMDTNRVLLFPDLENRVPPHCHHHLAGNQPVRKITEHIPAAFDRSGDHIVIGGCRGHVVVVSRSTMLTIQWLKITDSLPIRQLSFSQDGRFLLLNCQKEVQVLLFSVGILARRLESQSPDKGFIRACFSPQDPGLVAAATSAPVMTVCNRRTNLQWRLLATRPEDSVLDMAWHPTKAITAVVGTSGHLYVWDISRV